MASTKKPIVNGKIAYFGLVDWWLIVFTEEERKYIDDKFCPMNQRPNTLTNGKYLKISTDAASFLNSLATWFRNKSDASILQRIENKIDSLAISNPVEGIGYIRGRHFVTYVKDVKGLKKEGEFEIAEKLLLELVDATEQVSQSEGGGVAPWYYEELAKIYRRRKDYQNEVAILNRFAYQKHAPGVKPKKLLERLDIAKALANKDKNAGE